MSKPLKAFITYSHEDDEKRKKLRTYLAVMERNRKIKLRDDTDITAGGKARQEDIIKEVANSDILLYLVSAASLASKSCNQELTEAVKVGSRVIPIILESCDWLNDRLSNFQALPDKGKPINKWQLESDGWQNVVDGIRRFVEEMQVQSDSSSETSEKELRAELAFQHGNVLMMIGQVDMAIERYSHAIEFNPNHASTYNNRGVAYINKGEVGHAIEDHTKAIKLNPNDAVVYYNRGLTYINIGNPNRAITDLNKAIQLKPNFAEAYNNRGLAYSDRGDTDRAIEDFNRAIQYKPNYSEAYNNRGVAYRSKANFDRAVTDLNKAIQLKPNSVEAYYNRGIAFNDRGDTECAIEDYTRAIELKPDLAEAYYGRGIAFGRKGDTDCAISDFTRAIDLNPAFVAEAYYNRARVWLCLKEWQKAKSDLVSTREKGRDIVTTFHDDYGSIAGFERITGIQLPANIAAMLTPQQ